MNATTKRKAALLRHAGGFLTELAGNGIGISARVVRSIGMDMIVAAARTELESKMVADPLNREAGQPRGQA